MAVLITNEQEAIPVSIEFIEKQADVLTGERWIIDGNYSSTLELRLARADAVILLDMKTGYCLRNVLRRWLKFRNQSRPDMGGDNREHLSLGLLHYVATFRLTRLQSTLDKLKAYSEPCQLIVLKEKTELTQFIECI